MRELLIEWILENDHYQTIEKAATKYSLTAKEYLEQMSDKWLINSLQKVVDDLLYNA